MSHQELDTRTANRLWADYARTHDPRIREALILQFERLAYSIANRFARRGAETEDLCQVAKVGLVKAVDRFDPGTEYRFSTFATPTILGEIKRYFRDHSRPVHVPRSTQELSQRAVRANRELARRLGRVPTSAELAAELGVLETKVEEALSLEETTRTLSLDFEADGTEGGGLEQYLGAEDTDLERAELRVWAGEVLGHLELPLQEVIRLRYFSGLTQREVGRRLGLSQTQVSRIERKALEQLRGEMAVN